MRLLAALLLLTIVVMNQAALEAFGLIARAQVYSGTMDLREGGLVLIEATGRQNGRLVRIKCLWAAGYPVWIASEPLGSEM